MKYFFKRKYLNVLSVLGVLIFVFLNALSFHQVYTSNEAHRWVVHTYKVINTVYNVGMQTLLAEKKQFEFIATNDPSFLAAYKTAVRHVDFNLQQLKMLTEDNSDQQTKIQLLSDLIHYRLKFYEDIHNKYHEKSLQSEKFIVSGFENKQLAIVIREKYYQIINAEIVLLNQRAQFSQKSIFKIRSYVLFGSLFSAGLIFLSLLLLNKQLLLRMHTEKKLQASESKLTYLAYYDPLTGLPNRIAVENNINKALLHNKANNIALLYIDLDSFKNVNNSFGYDIGDKLLQNFSTHLTKMTHEHDVVSRFNSDQFVVILHQIKDDQEVAIIARKILDSLSEPITIDEHKIFITASMGISLYPHTGADAKSLIKNANIAMDIAKQSGRNNFQFCAPEMIKRIEDYALLDYDLHQALLHDQFILFYQPKFSLKTGKIAGVEALMRWKKPNVGLIDPIHFISLAEANGLIVPLGNWLIRTICLQGKKWQEEGLFPFPIAFNASIHQFYVSNFSTMIQNILQEIQFNPEWLELEITESALMESSQKNLTSIETLRNLGIKITLDDFGTGYSALSYLRQFKVDKLKIDKSFVDEIKSKNFNPNIIRAIIRMAHSMNITVIAEGVETKEQLRLLKKYRCDEVQGFFYSRPIPAEDIKKFMDEQP